MEVIPAINCEDFGCVKEKLQAAEKLGLRWVHFDVSDGTFTRVMTWNEPEELKSKFPALPAGRQIPNSKLFIEVHLMVEESEEYVGPWVGAGAKRILVHVEVLSEGVFRDIEILRYRDV